LISAKLLEERKLARRKVSDGFVLWFQAKMPNKAVATETVMLHISVTEQKTNILRGFEPREQVAFHLVRAKVNHLEQTFPRAMLCQLSGFSSVRRA
jgi:hypothetical protein